MMQAALPVEEKIEPVVEPVVEVIVELTPLQKCKKEENKFNLIVNTPENSRVRILNIKPKYKDCIALSNGKYHIEVSKKGYMQHKEWIILDDNTELEIEMIEFLKGHEVVPKVKKIKKIKKNSIEKIKYSGCTGFYQKDILDEILQKSTPFTYWDNIRWIGSCGKDKLMNGKGTLSFEVRKGTNIKIRGTMNHGYFKNKIYYSSSEHTMEKSLIVKPKIKESK